MSAGFYQTRACPSKGCDLEIEIFTGPNCAYCVAAKKLMDGRGQEYVEKDITDEDILAEFRNRLPRQNSLPQLFVDGEHIGSYEDLRLLMTDR